VHLEIAHLEKNLVIHHENQLAQTHLVDVKICPQEVDHRVGLERRVKQEMVQTHAGQGLRLSSANSHDFVPAFLNLISPRK
jgi:hypothetical protein